MKITINGQVASITEQEMLVTNSKNLYVVEFIFDMEWDGFSKIAVFKNGAVSIDVLLDNNNTCFIPHEVLKDNTNKLRIGVYGIKDNVMMPTTWCITDSLRFGAYTSGNETDDTPTLEQQILSDITAINTALSQKADLESPAFTGTPTINGVEIATPTQSDWNENDNASSAYIKNRPFYKTVFDSTNEYDAGETHATIPLFLGAECEVYYYNYSTKEWHPCEYGLDENNNRVNHYTVKEDSNGVLYIGDLAKADVPFFIRAETSEFNSTWANMMKVSSLKVCNLNGVEYHTIDKNFLPDIPPYVVTFTQTNGVWSADKTFNDVMIAVGEGKTVLGVVDSEMLIIYPQVVSPNIIFFGYIFVNSDMASANGIALNSDNTVTRASQMLPLVQHLEQLFLLTLPEVTIADNGKILKVVDGTWQAVSM